MPLRTASARRASWLALFTPKLVTALREPYRLADFGRDAVAGLTVAVVALPLSMAIGIGSGATPGQGLVTAIVAGFLISALGGSRFQIGGPTAAFIVVVYAVIERHGYGGLVLATAMAGILLVGIGALRLGTYIKYIPYPVVVGFTSGIAASIFVSQLKDLMGLDVTLPSGFFDKLAAIGAAVPRANLQAIAVTAVALGVIVGLRVVRPRWPGFLIALIACGGLVAAFGLDVATIGSEYGEIPRSLPPPRLPPFDLASIRAVLPDAVTIAFLAGIESLLSAVVADGMTGRRHRSNSELVAQGVANLASAAVGGLPATGAIARTATNIRAGARTPIAGMLHAVFLLAIVLVAAPVLSRVPLAALAAILAFVAWNIAEFQNVRTILFNAPPGDRVVLVTTFVLTLAVDLTAAIEVGVVMASVLFMHRMANAVSVEHAGESELVEDDSPDDAPRRREAFDGAAKGQRSIVYRINGPFFFGATQKFGGVMDRLGELPPSFVLDLTGVPFVDSTAAAMLKSFVARAQQHGVPVFLVGATPTVRRALKEFNIKPPAVRFAATTAAALAAAEPGS